MRARLVKRSGRGYRQCSCFSHHAPLFQRVDAPSLLRLFLNFDLLEAAAELVLEYVDAVLGRGHQYFGIEVKVTPTRVSEVSVPF